MSFNEWKTCKLKDVCTKIGSGSTPRGGSSVYKEEGTTLIRSQNIYNNYFEYNGLVFIDDEAANKLKSVEISEDDVLINITGDSVARTTIVPKELLPARVNQHVCILRTNSEYLDPFYLKSILVNSRMQEMMLSLAKSGGTRAALTKGMIENFEIPVPPIEEQKAIAKILSDLDNKIEVNNKINQRLEDMAQSIFKSWFVDFEFPNEEGKPYKSSGGEMVESELGMIPKGWEVKELGEIIDIFDYKRIPLSKNKREKMDKIYPYYGAASLMDYVDDYIFDGIYVLMGEDGTVIDENGFPILQYVWGQFWVNNHAHVLKGKGSISEDFLYILLKNQNISASVTGAVQLKINQQNLKSIKLVLPKDKELLDEFSKVIKYGFNKIRNNLDETERLIKLRDTLLPKLMSGEIRVPTK